MLYPYRCNDCGPFDIEKPMSQSDTPAPCPGCGALIADQDFSAKYIGGYVSREGSWSSGKLIPQLHPKHPDNMVTSQRQMEKVYRKHGINLDTGKFVSKEAQIAATLPQKQRTGQTGFVGGVDE